MMEMKAVESSQILRVGYDPERGVVRVEFKSRKVPGDISAIWEYGDEQHPITQMDFDLWIRSPSIGGFFGKHIKGVYNAACIEKR